MVNDNICVKVYYNISKFIRKSNSIYSLLTLLYINSKTHCIEIFKLKEHNI